MIALRQQAGNPCTIPPHTRKYALPRLPSPVAAASSSPHENVPFTTRHCAFRVPYSILAPGPRFQIHRECTASPGYAHLFVRRPLGEACDRAFPPRHCAFPPRIRQHPRFQPPADRLCAPRLQHIITILRVPVQSANTPGNLTHYGGSTFPPHRFEDVPQCEILAPSPWSAGIPAGLHPDSPAQPIAAPAAGSPVSRMTPALDTLVPETG